MKGAVPRTVLIGASLVLTGTGGLRAAGPLPADAPATRLAAQAPQTSSSDASRYRAVLDRYCVTCHNDQLQTAGLRLDVVDVSDVTQRADLWEEVVRKLRTRAMPPPPRPRPDAATYEAFASYLESSLDRAAALNPNPGATDAFHRLNRTEYQNAIRDLLALEIDSRSLLPAEDAAFGFDNNADALSFSPVLFERYVSAASRVARLAIGDPGVRPALKTYEASRLLLQDGRMSEDLPFGSGGGMAIRHHFPLDGEYDLKVNLQQARARGARQLDVRLDGERIKLFTVGGGRGTDQQQQESTPADQLEVRFLATAGTHVVGVTFLERTLAPEGLRPPHLPVANISGGSTELGVSSVEIGGPYEGPYEATARGDSPSRSRVFTCRPATNQDEEPCAEQILGTLAQRAFRRPVRDADVETLMGFYEAGRRGGDFDTGIQTALERILVDPEFLFRIIREPVDHAPGTAYRLSDLELASRLSFFLWSSIPDDELLDVAARGEIGDPAVLETQIQRMLADARSDALVSNFAAQWLFLRNLRVVAPDVNAFPEFDDNLRQAFQRETELFLGSQIREDRSVADLLAADYTFVNERLARHYGIPNVYGNRFRRVTLVDEQRRGLLGQGSILTVTSYATRTSPVVRGKWLLENILGAPPPPPPPNVPELPEGDAGGQPASVRERMEQHRRNPVCASCHSTIDPLGFALENFDAIGKWRATGLDGEPIDASGTLPDGRAFVGPAGLRDLLLSRREEFVSTATEKLLTYALGRGLEYYDAPAVRAIMRDAAPNEYRWSSIILGIAKSTPFQMRR